MDDIKKSKIKLKATEEYLTLYPETSADIVKLALEDIDAKTVEEAIEELKKRFETADTTLQTNIDEITTALNHWNQYLQTEITNRTTADTDLSGLITAETTARETEYAGLATTIQNIQTGVNESIASIQEVVNNSLSIASDASSTANEAAESANQAAEEATKAAESANAIVYRVDELDENKTSIKIKEEVIDEDTQETETIYTSIPNLYFNGEITRNTEEEIEQVTIILNCGGAN